VREEVEIGSETLSEPDRDLVEACARLLGADEVLLWRPAGPLALEPVDEWRSGSDGPATVPSGGRSPVEKGEGCAGRAWESGEIVAAGESTSIPIPVGDASRVRLVVELLGIDDRQPIPADDDDERLHRHMAEVVRGSQDAVLSKDLEGIVTSWNPAAEEMYGYTAEEAIGRHVSFIVPDDHENEEMQILERVCRGERLKTYETERIRKDGARINVSLTASPIESAAGEVLGASVIARDITSETRTRNAEAFLIAASRRLDRSLDPVETARTIVGTAVPSVAEICVIDFLRPDGCLGDSIAAGADPRAAAALEEIRRQSPLDPQSDHPAAQVLRAGMPMSWRDLTDPKVIEQVAQSAEHRRLIVDAGYRSAAVVPLVARGRTIGTLSFLHASSDLRYDAEDLAFLSELGDRAAMALDNAQLYDERVRIAANLQRGLRPPAPAEVRGLAISVVFEPAGEGSEIGGDFYDVLPTAEGC
jgi:PAS domain S-box-containing protein